LEVDMPDATARRVLIVSAAMGGGHLQISRELQRRLAERGHEARVVDVLQVMPGPAGAWLHWLYPWLVNRAPRLYQLVYDVFFLADQTAGERAGIPVRLSLPGLRRLAASFRPDVAVSTHPLSALALGELRRRGRLGCAAVTMITTFSVNNLWLHPSVDLELCISTEAASEVTRRTGRAAVVSGPVVRPAFLEPAEDTARGRVRAELGIPADSRVALVSTGSVGLAGSARAAAEAIASRTGWVPVVLCGRNEELRAQMQQIRGAVALGWVENTQRLLAAVDVLVDNAGGMTSKEALGFGVPVVTFRPISGHGRDDAAALERLGLTDVVEDPRRLVDVLDAIVQDAPGRRERVARGQALFVADAADLVEQATSNGPAPLREMATATVPAGRG
jgi:UDP-N-acetylglucosamine:LPS N-acetylglucosamine transferase